MECEDQAAGGLLNLGVCTLCKFVLVQQHGRGVDVSLQKRAGLRVVVLYPEDGVRSAASVMAW